MPDTKQADVRLRHMLDEIDGVTGLTEGLAAQDILGSYGHLRAVERAIQIISEAAKALPEELQRTEPGISWKKIIGIGNYLRHEYYRIDAGVLEGILRHELPELRRAVLRLAARLDS